MSWLLQWLNIFTNAPPAFLRESAFSLRGGDLGLLILFLLVAGADQFRLHEEGRPSAHKESGCDDPGNEASNFAPTAICLFPVL